MSFSRRDKTKRIVIAAGGTGGHLFPAQSLAQEIASAWPHVELHFMGSGLQKNPYFQKNTYAFSDIPSASFSLKRPPEVLRAIPSLWQGVRKSQAFLHAWQPHLVVGFGSFTTLPVLVAAWKQAVPLILHEQNCLPGRVNRMLSYVAQGMGVCFPEAAAYLRCPSIHVTLPLRPLRKGDVREACAHFHLAPNKPTLLLFGGSQGASFLNRWIETALQEGYFPKHLSLQLIHATGNQEDAERLSIVYRDHGVPAYVTPFIEEMGLAWSAADLFIGRGGAATIAESLAYAVPGIVVPFPHAKDDHQYANGKFLSEEVGSAFVIRQEDCRPCDIGTHLERILRSKEMKKKRIIEFLGAWKPKPFIDLLKNYVE